MTGPTGLTPDAVASVTMLWEAEIDGVLAPYIAEVYQGSATSVAVGLVDAFPNAELPGVPLIADEFAVTYMKTVNNRLVGVGNELWEDVRNELVDGIQQGQSIEQIAARIKNVANFDQTRASRIARTEVHSAAESGSVTQVKFVGYEDNEVEKEWISTHDLRTRDSHVAANNQRVLLNEKFVVGGSKLDHPGDFLGPADEIINCRCTTIMHIDEAPKYRCAPALVAATHVFHLPGKHDQKTHGRARQREMKVLQPYGDWGGQGKQKWMASDDIDVRSAQIWADSYEGQQAVMSTMRNIHAGQADPAADVDVSKGTLEKYSRVFHYDDDRTYGDDAVRDDIFNAASRLDDRLEAAPTVDYPLYRGMRVESPDKKLRVGDQFDSDVSSWSTRESHAAFYTSYQADSNRPMNGKPVIMRISPGSRAVNLDDGSLDRTAGSGEHLLRGTFKITNAEFNEDNEYIVDVEQLWLPG